jgi:tetratricopeptide (TPR) repeat protein
MDAYEDYTKAIELYPDFAKAYMNRSYVENMMGHRQASKADYETAQQKVREYRAKNSTDEGSFADTTKKYSALLSLDADFAKKDFDNELLQHRDIDIRLKPLYKMVLAKERPTAGSYAISRRYENALVDRISATSPIPVIITNKDSLSAGQSEGMEALLSGTGIAMRQAWKDFLRGMYHE